MSCLNRFKGWCQENFPFIEDDFNAITDYQLMCKLKEYVVSIGNDVANLEIDYNELAGKIVELEEIVNSMDGEFDNLVEEFNSLKTLVESYNMRIQANANRIEQVNTNLQELISLNIDDVKSLINSLKDYVDSQDTLILAEISTINNNIVLIRKEIEVIAEAIPKVRDTGTVITLNDTIKDAPIDIKLDPSELSQVTTTGAQLFNKTTMVQNGYISSGSVISGTSNDATKNIVVPCESNTTYTISKIADARFRVGYITTSYGNNVSVSGTITNHTGTSITITTGENAQYLVAYIYDSSEATHALQVIVDSIMVNKGQTASTLESYTGGIPAPNPQYPSNVHVITGDNNIVVSNSDNTSSQTKPLNLGDIEYCKIGTYSDHFFKAIDGDSIYDTLDDTTKESLTSGKWYIQKRIPKNVFNGRSNEENWAGATQIGTSTYYRYSNLIFTDTNKYLSHTPYISDNFSYNGTNSEVEQNVITNTVGSNLNRLFITIDTTLMSGTSAGNFKDWLSTHNTIVYYVLATPTYILLNDILQQQLDDIYETLKAYNDQTNITQINHDLPFIMTAITMKKGSVTDEV